MIDCHCHLEQKEFSDRDKIIKQCKQQLKAIITCCAHPDDLDLTFNLIKKYQGFVFCTIGIHPEFIKDINKKQIQETIEAIKKNKQNILSIGEIGLDYWWIKEQEQEWREKQKILFRRLIKLAKELNKPLVIHSRNASEDTIKILEKENIQQKVLMHLFQDRKLLNRVINNNWFISIGPGIKKSKNIRKIARDMPLKNIMLETDSPWFAQPGQTIGTPLNVNIAAEKIAEIKKLSLEQIEKQTDLNAIKFFNLPIK